MLNKLIHRLRTPIQPEDHGWEKWTRKFPSLSWRQIEDLASELDIDRIPGDIEDLKKALDKKCAIASLKKTKMGKILYG